MVRSTGAPPRDPVTQRGSRIWAIWNLSWDHVGSFLGSKRSPKENFSTEVRFGGSISGRGKTSNKKGVVLRVFSGHFEGYVGPMLGNLGSKLGQCFGICWDLRGSSMVFGIKVWTQQKLPFVEIHLGGTWRAMSDPCWANVGSYGVYVGPMLGHLVGTSWSKKKMSERHRFTLFFFHFMQPERIFYDAFNLKWIETICSSQNCAHIFITPMFIEKLVSI